MYSQFYADNPLLFWPLVGLVVFVISFAAVIVYVTFGLRDKRKVEYLAGLPLESAPRSVFESRDLRVGQTELTRVAEKETSDEH